MRLRVLALVIATWVLGSMASPALARPGGGGSYHGGGTTGGSYGGGDGLLRHGGVDAPGRRRVAHAAGDADPAGIHRGRRGPHLGAAATRGEGPAGRSGRRVRGAARVGVAGAAPGARSGAHGGEPRRTTSGRCPTAAPGVVRGRHAPGPPLRERRRVQPLPGAARADAAGEPPQRDGRRAASCRRRSRRSRTPRRSTSCTCV